MLKLPYTSGVGNADLSGQELLNALTATLPLEEAPAHPAVASAVWTVEQAEALYHVPAWGAGYFHVNEAGHVAVRPQGLSGPSIDLFEVVSRLRRQGIHPPLLIRFQDLLRTRVVQLNRAFRRAIAEVGYANVYQGVYPIKVNQLREVVEEILEAGQPFSFGLECGSKPELLAALPYLERDDMLLICNGCKDRAMMQLILAGQGLGKRVIPVLERMEEFELLLEVLQDRLLPRASTPVIFGVRLRLSATGAGLWAESGGETSKFGLSLSELLGLLDRVADTRSGLSLQLLHFHLGSQIASLTHIREAVTEAARIYARLRQRGFSITYLDIGGGLGVTYEAGNPQAPGSIDYTLEEYARVVISTLRRVCDEEGVPPPVVISESGRALTAYHSVFVTEVLGMRSKPCLALLKTQRNGTLPTELKALWQLTESLPETTPLEAYQHAQALRETINQHFREGRLSLEQKAFAEQLYWMACSRIQACLAEQRTPSWELPQPLHQLTIELADHYLCNFSVFRSLIDHWAIGQHFPIMPIHRLNEPPTRQGILVDLTCDSDGQVSDFVTPVGQKHTLELHPLRPNEPYYLGFFLMGAYQDIMGDQHNLFGRVTEAHVYADEDEPGNFYLELILPGATVQEQLAQVQYYPNDLERRMNRLIQEKVRTGAVRPREGVEVLELYRQIFRGSTYLEA
jgi:arginine decarboxylase